MLSCWHDLLILFCLRIFYLFLPPMGWLGGVGIFGLIECYSLSPGLAQRTPNNNNNNNNNNCTVQLHVVTIQCNHTW